MVLAQAPGICGARRAVLCLHSRRVGSLIRNMLLIGPVLVPEDSNTVGKPVISIRGLDKSSKHRMAYSGVLIPGACGLDLACLPGIVDLTPTRPNSSDNHHMGDSLARRE
jgi:hypothetical protein